MLRLAKAPVIPVGAGAILSLARKRMAANKRWVLALSLGIFIAAVLLAVAPIYHRAMVDLGLRDAVARDLVAPTGPDGLLPYEEPAIQQPEVGLARVEFARAPVLGEEGSEFGRRVQASLEARLGWLATSYGSHVRINVLGSRPGEPERPFAENYVQSLEGWEERVRVVDGQLPGAAPPGADLQVVINETTNSIAGLKPGDRFQLNLPCPGGVDECDTLPEPVTVVVAAIVEPIVPEDPFWAAGPSAYLEPNFTDTPPGMIIPILLPTEQFKTFVDRLPEGMTAYRGFYSFGDPEGLTRGTVNRVLDDVEAIEREYLADEVAAFSPMEHTVREFEKEADHQRAPLTILLAEVAAIALFYLVLVSSAVLDRQARQIALLRSRGTSAGQVLLSFLIEALLIALVATLAAPFIAAGIISLLGVTPIFEEVTGGDRLDVTLLPSAFLFAGGGALLGVVALMVPAMIASRRGLVSQRQAETRPGKPFFQRYFLDVAFTAIALLLLWELNERGSVYEPSSTGGVTTDPLLLASPALIVFSGAMIFLRFYPIVLRWLGWLALRGPGVSAGMGISTLVRRPGQYGQLALLLLMAVAVGTFAASYSATTDRSLKDRAAFESGVPYRGLSVDGTMGSNGPATDAQLRELPYQEAATAVLRTPASVSLSGSGGRNVQLLAIDPDVTGEMVWFREDFADTSLDGVLFPLRGGGSLPGISLPGTPTTFHASIYMPEQRDSTTLWVRMEDAAGTPILVDMDTLDFSGWEQRSGAIEVIAQTLQPPFRLTALIFTAPPNRGVSGGDNSIIFDDFAVTDAAGTRTVVEDFESPAAGWQPIISSSVTPDRFEVTTEQKQSGSRAGKVTLAQGTSTARRGIFPSNDRVPIPIAASEQMLAELGLADGGQAVLLVGDVPVPVAIHSTYRLFPTLFSEDGASAIINRDDLNIWLRTWALSDRLEMNEAWFTLAPGTTAEQREEFAALLDSTPFRLEETVDQAVLFAEIDQDPLLAAGGTGILAIGFAATLILLAAAAVVVLFTDAERRRPELAVMRALGFSRGQTARMLALEYGLLLVSGIGLGAFLGRQLGDRMLSFLNVTEEGERVEPEFILETDWALLGASALVIIAAFAITLGIVLTIARRVSAGQVLRTD